MAILFNTPLSADLAELSTRPNQREDAAVAATPNFPPVEDSLSNPEYWGFGSQQQAPPQQQQQAPPQQQPQIAQGKVQEGNPLALPKDMATLQSMIQQGVYQTIGGLANTNQERANRINSLRQSFLASPDHRPWWPAAEDHFNEMMSQGYSIDDAAKSSLRHVGNLARNGFKPPEPSKRSLIPSQFGHGQVLSGTKFRADEDPNEAAIYTEQERKDNHERYIQDRRKYQEFVKTNGRSGKSLQDLYPKAFE